MMKVAIITRTKNRPNFLRRAIESVAAQTYGEYTHVIVNDGGDTSEVEKIVESLPEKARKKVQLFHRDKPSGAPDTIFTESIDRVESEYFAIHDDDDTWHEDFLLKTAGHLDDNPEEGAVVARADKVVEEIDGSEIIERKRMKWMEDMRVVSLYHQCIDNQMTPIATLYRRDAYQKVGKFDDTLAVVGDWEFGLRLLLNYDVGFIDPGFSLANYHHREFKKGTEGNTSFSGNDKHRYYTNKVINKYLREELAQGRLGVGYIMSDLKYSEGQMGRIAKSVLPSFVANRLKSRFSR